MLKRTALLICNVLLDTVVTVMGIYFGFLVEVNPLMVWLMNGFGLSAFIVLKLGLTALLVLVLEYTRKHKLLTEQRVVLYYIVSTTSFFLVYFFGELLVNFFQYNKNPDLHRSGVFLPVLLTAQLLTENYRNRRNGATAVMCVFTYQPKARPRAEMKRP